MSAERTPCERCFATGARTTDADGICCSSHNKWLCHRCYRLTHFVEVCGCARCDKEGLPRIFPERPLAASSSGGQQPQDGNDGR